MNNKFYNANELLSHSKYNIFFSLGGRFIGKSTEFQRHLIRDFLKKNKKFGVIVKFKDDLKTFAKNYYSDNFFEKWYPDYEFMYKKEKYYIRKKCKRKNEKLGWKECGYAIALNQNATIKSTTSYQDIENLIFEEFIPLEWRYVGSKQDPELEPRLLISVYQSIARGKKGKHTRPVKLYLISNNYTLNNPYFTYFKILNLITKNNTDSIFKRFYEYKSDKLNYIIEFSQITPDITGLEVDDLDSGATFIDYRNKLKFCSNFEQSKLLFQLTLNNKYIINVARINENLFFYQAKKINKSVNCYTCSTIKYESTINIEVLKLQKTYKLIKFVYHTNKALYDKLETYINLTNILIF